MPFQVDISLTYEAVEDKWRAFVKFDFPLNHYGTLVSFVMSEGPTFQQALYQLGHAETFLRYIKLGKDNEEGASQNAEGLVN